mgnify:CR=1 FL=1
MNKIHIEKNSVQETLIVPLFGRKMCAERSGGKVVKKKSGCWLIN